MEYQEALKIIDNNEQLINDENKINLLNILEKNYNNNNFNEFLNYFSQKSEKFIDFCIFSIKNNKSAIFFKASSDVLDNLFSNKIMQEAWKKYPELSENLQATKICFEQLKNVFIKNKLADNFKSNNETLANCAFLNNNFFNYICELPDFYNFCYQLPSKWATKLMQYRQAFVAQQIKDFKNGKSSLKGLANNITEFLFQDKVSNFLSNIEFINQHSKILLDSKTITQENLNDFIALRNIIKLLEFADTEDFNNKLQNFKLQIKPLNRKQFSNEIYQIIETINSCNTSSSYKEIANSLLDLENIETYKWLLYDCFKATSNIFAEKIIQDNNNILKVLPLSKGKVSNEIEGVKVFYLNNPDKQKFRMMVHVARTYSDNKIEYYKNRYGKNNICKISASLVEENKFRIFRHTETIFQNESVIFAFINNFSPNNLMSANTFNTNSNLYSSVAYTPYYLSPKDLVTQTKKGSINELNVLMDETTTPSHIICVDEINELSLKTAQALNLPIIVYSEKSYYNEIQKRLETEEKHILTEKPYAHSISPKMVLGLSH